MSSYQEEFNHFSSVARLGNADDVRVSYSVFVGTPSDDDDGFLGTGFFSADDFTTWSDAAKARLLALTVLGHVDDYQKNGTAKDTDKAPSRDLHFTRQKLFRSVEETVRNTLATVPKDAPHFDCILTAELICSLNDVFDTTAD